MAITRLSPLGVPGEPYSFSAKFPSTVCQEARTVTIEAENRTVTIEAENRTLTIAAENRTVTI